MSLIILAPMARLTVLQRVIGKAPYGYESYDSFLENEVRPNVTYVYLYTLTNITHKVTEKLVESKATLILVEDENTLKDAKRGEKFYHKSYVWQLRTLLNTTQLSCFKRLSTARSYWHFFGRAILPATLYFDLSHLLRTLPKMIEKAKAYQGESRDKSILIYKDEGGLGDTVLALPTVNHFLSFYPHAKLGLTSSVIELLKSANFHSDRLVSLEALTQEDKDKFDIILDLYNYTRPNSGKDFGKNRQIRFCGFKTIKQHVKQHYSLGLSRFHKHLPTNSEDYPYLEVPEFTQDRPYITIHTGAGYLKKCWPQSHFMALSEMISKCFPDLEIKFVYGPKDPHLPHSFYTKNPNCTVVPPAPLHEIASLIKGGLVHIGNDAGITHVAGSINQPLITIFGPTGPGVWIPSGDTVHLIWGKGGVCHERCNYTVMKDCPDQICLNRIEPERVLRRVLRVLQESTLNEDKSGWLISNPVVSLVPEEKGVKVYDKEENRTYFIETHTSFEKELIERLKKSPVSQDDLETEKSTQLAAWLIEKELAFLVPCL